MRIFDAPTTRRGMVRVHGGTIADIAFASVRDQVLLAAVSVDGCLSISHVRPPVPPAGSAAAAPAAEAELEVPNVVLLHLSGAYGPQGSSADGGVYRPRLVWRPGRAELLVATGAHVLRIDVVTVMVSDAAAAGAITCAPGALPSGVCAVRLST